MAVQSVPSAELAQLQVSPLTPPSGSPRLADTGLPASGVCESRDTVPASSTLPMLIVTVMVSSSLESASPMVSLPSLTLTVRV